MARTMYDSVDITKIPADAQMVAGYVDGSWPTYDSLATHFPHAIRVSITVTGRPGADVADVESGDLTPQSGAAWARAEHIAGHHPTLYCSASYWQTCRDACHNAGLSPADVAWWIAHYDNDPTIPPGAIAKQYRNDPAADLDYSSVAAYWPGVDPAPTPTPDRPHGDPPPSIATPVWWHNPDDGHLEGWRDVHVIPVLDRYHVEDVDGQRLMPWLGHGWTRPQQVPATATVPGWIWTARGWAHL